MMDDMTVNAAKLLEDAVKLSERDRADLAARLLESLDAETDQDAEAAWDAEIARRIQELDGGSVQPVDEHTARRMIRGISDVPPEA